jgi:hypothetical protein
VAAEDEDEDEEESAETTEDAPFLTASVPLCTAPVIRCQKVGGLRLGMVSILYYIQTRKDKSVE